MDVAEAKVNLKRVRTSQVQQKPANFLLEVLQRRLSCLSSLLNEILRRASRVYSCGSPLRQADAARTSVDVERLTIDGMSNFAIQ